jgi:hypothetical protein
MRMRILGALLQTSRTEHNVRMRARRVALQHLRVPFLVDDAVRVPRRVLEALGAHVPGAAVGFITALPHVNNSIF